MAKIYNDSLNRIVLDDEQGDTLIFDVTDDKVAIYQDSQNLVTRTVLESLEDAGLLIKLDDIPAILDQLKEQLGKAVV